MKKFLGAVVSLVGHILALPFRLIGFFVGFVCLALYNGWELAEDFLLWISS